MTANGLIKPVASFVNIAYRRRIDFSKERLLKEYGKNKDRVQEIIEFGERATHLFPNNCFYAHLSIYSLPGSIPRSLLRSVCVLDGDRVCPVACCGVVH